jgi:hypothetical protein
MNNWGIKWQLQFKDATEVLCDVRISDYGYTGTVTQLTGAATPLVTKEDNSDDALSPLRRQVATISFVTSSSGLLQSIAPNSNTERLVEIYRGGSLVWLGFLQAKTYEQQYGLGNREVSINAVSLVGALEYVRVPSINTFNTLSYWQMLVEAMDLLRVTPSMVMVINSMTNADDFLQQYIRMGKYVRDVTLAGNVYDTPTRDCSNYRTLIEDVCTLHGLTLRDIYGGIIFIDPAAVIDNDGSPSYRMTIWRNWANIKNGSYTPTSEGTDDLDSLSQLIAVSMGTNNTTSTQGRYDGVMVESDTSPSVYELLPTLHIKQNATNTIHELHGDEMCIQFPALPRYSNLNGITYLAYEHGISNDTWGETPMGPDDDQNIEIMQKIVALAASQNNTGYGWAMAVPCAFSMKGDGYKDAIYLNLARKNDMVPNNTRFVPPIYTVAGTDNVTLMNGNIVIDFNTKAFIANDDARSLYMLEDDNGKQLLYYLICRLRVGTEEDGYLYYYGDGTWTDNVCHFGIALGEDGSPYGGNTLPREVRPTTGGILIPAGSTYHPVLRGNVVFQILGQSYAEEKQWTAAGSGRTFNSQDDIGVILSDLSIRFYPHQYITDIDIKNNLYVRGQGMNNSANIRTIRTEIGTRNGNIQSSSFLMNANGDYIQGMGYTDGNSITIERPEERLADKVMEIFGERRIINSHVCRASRKVQHTIFSDGQKAYMAVETKNDWRRNIQTIKTIEIKDI